MQLSEILEKVSKKLGPDFEFRPWQKEAVLAICKAYTENPEGAVILDAPTGTGKSIVATLSSLVLTDWFKRIYSSKRYFSTRTV